MKGEEVETDKWDQAIYFLLKLERCDTRKLQYDSG